MQRQDSSSSGLNILCLPAPSPAQEWLGFPFAQTSFFGREQDIADVSALVQDPGQRLVTLLGPGGVGKTRLAIAVAEHAEPAFPHGAAFISLAQLSQPDQIADEVAAVLGVLSHPDRTLVQSIINSLHGRRFLMILDNLEHLTGEQTSHFILGLLEYCPLLTVLATSREPLRLSLEQRHFTLPLSTVTSNRDVPLTALAALQLFVARAGAVRRGFACSPEEAVTIAEICHRLDGLPLAIELAAAWMRMLSPSGLLARLEQSLPLLMSGHTDQPVRLQTMRAAITWSYELLSTEEAAGLRRLSVFRGGFTLEAAAHVLHAPRAVSPEIELSSLQLVGALCDKSLLSPRDSIGTIQRFGMLETVREFAHEQLTEAELVHVQCAHAEYYRDLTERLEPILLGPEETVWLRLYDAEMGNLREAMAWGLLHAPELTLRICGAIGWFWTWYHLAEGRYWLARSLDATPDAPPLLRARALAFATSIAALIGDATGLQELVPAMVATAEQTDSWLAKGHAAWLESVPAAYAADLDTAASGFDRALTLMTPASSPSDVGLAAYMRASRGDIAFMHGHRALGISLFDEAMEQLRTTGGSCIAVIVFSNYAGWLLTFEMARRAREVLQEAVRFASTSAVTWQSAMTLAGLAFADAIEGKTQTAARLLGALEAICIRADLMIPFFYQARVDQVHQLVYDELGSRVFQREWDAGYADPVEVVSTIQEDSGNLRERRVSALTRELGLTRREGQVLALVAAGQSDREIAASLFISVRTASKHVGSILEKLGATSRAEAAVRAMHLGLT